MNPYNCIIVDDERPALKLLSAYIAKLPHLKLIASCENAMQAIAALQTQKIDILFLDIQMPELTGLDLLKILKDPPEVVLTTAYRDFAVEGYALNATDYLVKPFSFERFTQAANKATQQINLKFPTIGNKKVIPEISTTVSEDHFYIRTNHKMQKVLFKEILYIESMREYVSVFTEKQRFVINQSMNKMQAELPANQFMRIHRSYTVNLNQIETITGNLIQIREKKIPIGASYKKQFFQKIKLL